MCNREFHRVQSIFRRSVPPECSDCVEHRIYDFFFLLLLRVLVYYLIIVNIRPRQNPRSLGTRGSFINIMSTRRVRPVGRRHHNTTRTRSSSGPRYRFSRGDVMYATFVGTVGEGLNDLFFYCARFCFCSFVVPREMRCAYALFSSSPPSSSTVPPSYTTAHVLCSGKVNRCCCFCCFYFIAFFALSRDYTLFPDPP